MFSYTDSFSFFLAPRKYSGAFTFNGYGTTHKQRTLPCNLHTFGATNNNDVSLMLGVSRSK